MGAERKRETDRQTDNGRREGIYKGTESQG